MITSKANNLQEIKTMHDLGSLGALQKERLAPVRWGYYGIQIIAIH